MKRIKRMVSYILAIFMVAGGIACHFVPVLAAEKEKMITVTLDANGGQFDDYQGDFLKMRFLHMRLQAIL